MFRWSREFTGRPKADTARQVKDILEREVYFCELPFMTDQGTFIINGVERVVVSQLQRSPGLYFSREGQDQSALLVPLRGAWLELVVDKHNSIVVLLDRKRRIPGVTFMRAMGFTHEDMIEAVRAPGRTLPVGKVVAETSIGKGRAWSARVNVTEGMLMCCRTRASRRAGSSDGSPAGLDIVANSLRSDRTTSKKTP